jgi:NADH-quinone oxidoreductase subunit L
MGGLRRQLPTTFWTFLIGSGALSAVPLVTAGFYSKDKIIWLAYAADRGGVWLWSAALAGAFLTSLYTFRLVFRVFFGPSRVQVRKHPGGSMKTPLLVLAVLSIIAGFIELPRTLGGLHLFSDFLSTALPKTSVPAGREAWEGLFELISMGVALGGIGVVYLFVLRVPRLADGLARSAPGARLHRFWFSGWGFDVLYDRLLAQPYIRLAQINRNDCIDRVVDAVAWLNRRAYSGLSVMQSGRLRAYAMGIAAGAVFIIGMVVFL